MCWELMDEVASRNGLFGRDLVEALTLDDVEKFLISLGVQSLDRRDDCIVCPTICHNPVDEADSMKLYYYDENKSFHCYTECSENFNIIELYKRYMALNHAPISYSEAVEYIQQFVRGNGYVEKETKVIHNEKKQNKVDFISLPEYNGHVMDCFVNYKHPLWVKDGIGEDAMRRFDIKFSIGQNKIVIPHKDIDGRLVGIRARAINPEDIEYGKYMPIKVGDTLYNHQLGFNLYGIYEHKDAIRKTKRAVIFESEKSVMLSDTFYPGFSNAVATCGSQLNRFQVNLLVKKLGVNEIILCFDKEYKDLYDPKCATYRKKLIEKCTKYSGLAQFYYVFDEHNLIGEKDSPIDRGPEIYEKLVSKKIKIKG